MEPNNQTTAPAQPVGAVNTPTQQPEATAPQTPQSKSNKMPLLILSVIVLAIVVLGGGIFMMLQSSSTPNPTQTKTLQTLPSPTQSQEQTSVEDIVIEDVNGDITEIEGSLKNL